MSARARRSDQGFTLIELGIVIMIIGVLLAIVIPTFLGVRERSQNRRVQVELRNAIISARVEEIPTEIYSQDPATLTALEASITWVTGTSPAIAGPVYVSIAQPLSDPSTGREIYLAGRSRSGTCFYIHHNPVGAHAVEYASDSDCGTSDSETYSPTGW